MSTENKEAVALCVSDVHLSQNAPISRAEKDNWFEVMKTHLNCIRDWKLKHPEAAVIYPGDIFDRWNSSPELINFAIINLPPGYAIPGQHDLPYHNYKDIRRSAYWTLVSANIITDMRPGDTHSFETLNSGVTLFPFPWGAPITPPSKHIKETIKLAVIHGYCWKNGYGLPFASNEKHYKQWTNKLKGYDAAVFGDNHRPFKVTDLDSDNPQGLRIANCGTFIHRKSDERMFPLCWTIFWSDGSFTQEKVEFKEEWCDTRFDPKETDNFEEEAEAFVKMLKEVNGKKPYADFIDSVMRFIENPKISKHVRELITKIVQEAN